MYFVLQAAWSAEKLPECAKVGHTHEDKVICWSAADHVEKSKVPKGMRHRKQNICGNNNLEWKEHWAIFNHLIAIKTGSWGMTQFFTVVQVPTGEKCL